MSNDDNTRFSRLRSAASATRTLASAWTQAKTAKLQYRAHQLQTQLDSPDSWVAAGGDDGSIERFTTREAQRDQLETYHDIRLDGGIVATLLEARALMVFGVGGEFTHEREFVAEWLNNQFDHLDLLTLDIGEDALFYGYSIAEVRETVNGDFGKVEFIEPWTTTPVVSNKGDILEWEQEIDQRHGPKQTQSFDPDDILHFKVMKESGRDPVGMSMLGRAMDEATAYRDNQQAIQNAVTLHGFPKWHIKLGREGGAVIDDNELRRARPKFDNIDELTKWVTGQDVDIQTIAPDGFEFEQITEHDLSKLAIAFMLPVELTQLGGGDGLGTGFPARLRERLFMLSAQAQQNQLAGQLTDQLARRLIREYSPFDEAVVDDLQFRFDDPITDMEELQTKASAIGQDLTVNERREMFGFEPLEDDDVGDSFEAPGQPDPAAGGGFGEDAALQQPQRGDGGVAAESLQWITEYAKTDGSVDDLISDWLPWLEAFDGIDAEAPQRARVGVELFAADQGIGFDEAVGQPLNNLVRFFHRNRTLADAETTREEIEAELAIYDYGFEHIVWADRDDDHDLAQPVFADEDDVPANVRNRLERAADNIPWDDTEGAPPANLRDFFVRKLSQPQGWSVTSLSNGLRQEFGTFDGPDHRENIARTKSAQLLNEATDLAIDDLAEDLDEEVRIAWVGPMDDSTTEPCRELQEETDPEHGGSPIPRSEFDQRKNDLAREHFPDFEGRGEAIHWQERHKKEPFLPEA